MRCLTPTVCCDPYCNCGDQIDKPRCQVCGIDINQNEIEAYDHKCRICFRNEFQESYDEENYDD